ncbi:hypothetical protein M409DRAFT_27323 [Zasmidium cellare ATCC 36951]|uniref:Integral membrane protein n=1 Tax=Zasmidium cellare ATCC 36951 TaxID=1080233 RepID=A0A6A6C9I8_ZASCE|nr:uncharacterized protein M409DRAFT_27323 [Zasmidium cellare ATCC 36951]KAF2162319.1 hypothetical protein M409DRAFT_27323 [Zasmidium cellare ATCC 36951]
MTSLDKIETKATRSSAESTRSDFVERVITAASSIKTKFSSHASGPAAIFNPTNVRLRVHTSGSDGIQHPATDMAYLWRSRDNRKGRTSIAVPRDDGRDPLKRPRFTASRGQVAKGILRMFTVFPYYDMAYLVGVLFAIGSAIFVANGIICLLPIAYPDLKFGHEARHLSGGLTCFLGALAYQFGALVAYLEAVNDGSFHGSAMKKFLQGHEDEEKQLVKAKLYAFFDHLTPIRGRERRAMFGSESGLPTPFTTASISRRGAMDLGSEDTGSHEYSRFRWWPTWKSLKKHCIFEIGWLACSVQLVSATLYMVVGIVDLPGIMNTLEPWQENLAYWIPDMVASAGFIFASLLFTLEIQDKWFKPQPRILGWWVGSFALLGSIGFEICAAFGPATYGNEDIEWQSSIATTWASAAFLIASMLQW